MAFKFPRDIPIDDGLPLPLQDKYVRVPIAVEVTGAHESTIHRHLRNGTLEGIKLTDRWLVSRDALAVWAPGEPGNPNWINAKETA